MIVIKKMMNKKYFQIYYIIPSTILDNNILPNFYKLLRTAPTIQILSASFSVKKGFD